MFGFVIPLQQVMYFYFSSLVIWSNFQSGVSSVFCGWLRFVMSGAGSGIPLPVYFRAGKDVKSFI